MDLLIIDSIQYGHKSIFEPPRPKFFQEGTPQTPLSVTRIARLRTPLRKILYPPLFVLENTPSLAELFKESKSCS